MHQSNLIPATPQPRAGQKRAIFISKLPGATQGQGLGFLSPPLPSGMGTIQYLFLENSNISPGMKSVDNGGTFSPVLLQVQNLAPRCGDGGDTGQLLLNKIQ